MALYSSVLQMYLNWANSLLCERGVLVSEVQQLQDGRIFALLIDVLNGDEITFTETEDDEESNLNRIQAVLTYLQKQEISLKTSAKDILRGDMKSILDILWALILHFTIHDKETPSSRRTLRNGRLTLMEWCHDQLPVETFKMHWSITDNFRENNSLAALIETCSSSEALDEEKDSLVRRLTTALIAAEETLGILKSHLSPSDVIHGAANEYSIVIFLALLKRKVTLLAPELSVVSTPSPDPQCHPSNHIPEPWASLLRSTFSFKFVRVEPLADRLNLFKSSLAANASSPNAPQDSDSDSDGDGEDKMKNFEERHHSTEHIERQYSSSAVRRLEISHNQHELYQHRTSLTNGGHDGHHSVSRTGEVKSAKNFSETFHQSVRTDHSRSTLHVKEVSGVPFTGSFSKSDSHLGLEGCGQLNGPMKGLWEVEAVREGDKMDSRGGKSEVDGLFVGLEEETVKSEKIRSLDTDGIDCLDDNDKSPKGQSFEDELLGLLEMIGMEGRQLRQKLNSAEEREAVLLGQLQETVAGKHEEKVIARLIQELEMLRRENRSLFREAADARSEVSRKAQICDELQDRCKKLEMELQKAKSSEECVRIRGEGSCSVSEMSVKELRDGNENLVINGQTSWTSDARTSDGLEEMMRRSAEEDHRLRSQLAAYGADNSQKYHKTKEALKTSEAENSDLKEKCRKLKRLVDDLKMDLEIKEKRMSRYERYLEILRQQNAKLIAHIGGKPLEGDERVDVAKLELEEIKEEYKEVRKKLELAEEDRALLSRELEQVKCSKSLTDLSGIPSLENALPEFHNLPFLESPKGQRKPEEGGRITSVVSTSVDEVQNGKSNSPSGNVLSKDDGGTTEGDSGVSETKRGYIPEVQRTTMNGHLSDVSSLRSYDVSETETAQSDSDHAFVGPSVATMMAHSRLTELRQRFGLNRGVRSPSLGSLIRARATEGKCQGGGDSDSFEESGRESSLLSDEETFQTPCEERISTSTLPPRSLGSVNGGMGITTNPHQGQLTPAKRDSEMDTSVYYTPTEKLQHDVHQKQKTGYSSIASSSVLNSKYSEPRSLGTSSIRLATSRTHGNSKDSYQESGTMVGSWNNGTVNAKTVSSGSNVFAVNQRSQNRTIFGERGSTLGSSSSSRVPRWRQLRYSRAKSLHDSKAGTFSNQAGKIGDTRAPLGTPSRARISASPGYTSVKPELQTAFSDLTNSRYTDRCRNDSLPSLYAKTSVNIPDNDDEFKPLPDQLVEPKKLADVTPPRNQRSPLTKTHQESAVKVRLTFDDVDTSDYIAKPGSPQSERVSIQNARQSYCQKESAGAVNHVFHADHVQVKQVNFESTRLKNEASSGSITTSPKSRSPGDNFQKVEVQSMCSADGGRNAADAVAVRVICQADSGISLSSLGCDGSLAERDAGYIHKMLSPADQTYANSIIDKYLSKA